MSNIVISAIVVARTSSRYCMWLSSFTSTRVRLPNNSYNSFGAPDFCQRYLPKQKEIFIQRTSIGVCFIVCGILSGKCNKKKTFESQEPAESTMQKQHICDTHTHKIENSSTTEKLKQQQQHQEREREKREKRNQINEAKMTLKSSGCKLLTVNHTHLYFYDFSISMPFSLLFIVFFSNALDMAFGAQYYTHRYHSECVSNFYMRIFRDVF